MGSNYVGSFLNHLDPKIRQHVKRCSCEVLFRFGNQGTLKATHAIVVPVCGMWLKIAIVSGATPFLVSNTLLRAVGAMIDTCNHQLIIPKFQAQVPLELTNKGLYLINMNQLFALAPVPDSSETAAETYAQETLDRDQKGRDENQASCQSQPSFNGHGKSKVTGQTEQANHMNPPPVSLSCQSCPVTNENLSAESECPKFFTQSTRSSKSGKVAIDQHEQLESSPVQSASQLCPGLRSGTNRALEPDRAQGHAHELWKSSHGQNVRGDLEQRSTVDQMVPQPLRSQHKDRTPKDDPVHPTDDRGIRERDSPAISQGIAQSLSSSSKEPGSPSDANASINGDRGGVLRNDERSTMDRGIRDSRGHSCPSDSIAQPGECDAAHDRADVARTIAQPCHGSRRSSGNCNHSMGRSLEQLSEDDNVSCHWALKAGEIDTFCESSPNKERQHFWSLVRKMEKELSQTAAIIKPEKATSIDLLEVFCSDHSKLTSQVIQLGGQAKRFGLNQGDLMTSEGRRELFALVIRHRPRHIWVSPVCGPWSSWSNFNSQRSLEAWDHVNDERWMMLTQVALCLVLCRYQHRCQRHAHWEQPKRSHMLKLPYVQEIQRYMRAAKPDLCQAGDLRDPTTNQFIQKGLEIHTSSQKMYEMLDPLKCPKNHVHQIIEGSTQVQGQKMLRSKFTETYPRKFARLVAKEMLKHRFPLEKPVGSLADPMLCVLASLPTEVLAASAQERPSKRSRRAPIKGVKHDAETGALEQPQGVKRVKLSTGSHDGENDPAEQQPQPRAAIQEITNRIEAILPRVGKKQIDSPGILQDLQKEFPDVIIKKVVACKGTDRRWGPPKGFNPVEAPLRRSIMKLRENLKIIVDPSWEKYAELSNRQIIRKSPACQVNITMFSAPGPAVSSSHDSTQEPASSEGHGTQELNHGNGNNPENTEASEHPSETPNPNEVSEMDSSQEVPKAIETCASNLSSHRKAHEPAGPSSSEHGARFMALPKEEQAMLRRAHQNLCHPSAERLSAVLKTQGCRPELTQAVFDMKCPTCMSCQLPTSARPSTFKDALDFNDKVFIDGISWTSKQGRMFHFYHLIDQATNFHVAIPAPSRAADQAVLRASEAWFQWAGPPNTMIMDPATEFTSTEFETFLQRHDVRG